LARAIQLARNDNSTGSPRCSAATLASSLARSSGGALADQVEYGPHRIVVVELPQLHAERVAFLGGGIR
jgi:nitrate/nitrite transporter NarK